MCRHTRVVKLGVCRRWITILGPGHKGWGHAGNLAADYIDGWPSTLGCGWYVMLASWSQHAVKSSGCFLALTTNPSSSKLGICCAFWQGREVINRETMRPFPWQPWARCLVLSLNLHGCGRLCEKWNVFWFWLQIFSPRRIGEYNPFLDAQMINYQLLTKLSVRDEVREQNF